MAYLKGGADFARFMSSIPAQLEAKVFKGAAKAAANVIADDARARSISGEVSAAIRTKVESAPGQVRSTVFVKRGWAHSLALWQEYGTEAHFISVDDSQRQGMSTRRVNDREKDGAGIVGGARRVNNEDAPGSIVIGGSFVGTTVHHPGARPHPFMRPALDHSEAEAIAAAQRYIDARISRSGITGSAEPEESEE